MFKTLAHKVGNNVTVFDDDSSFTTYRIEIYKPIGFHIKTYVQANQPPVHMTNTKVTSDILKMEKSF